MAKVTIYLSIVERDGKKHLHLRDSNKKCADESLVTEVSRDDLVVWKRDKKSGIKIVKNIDFEKGKEPFIKGVYKAWCQAWKGTVSKDAKGEYPYHVAYIICGSSEIKPTVTSGKNGDPPPPIIKVKD